MRGAKLPWHHALLARAAVTGVALLHDLCDVVQTGGLLSIGYVGIGPFGTVSTHLAKITKVCSI